MRWPCTQPRTGRHAQNVGRHQRIAEHALVHRARCRQRSAHQQPGQHEQRMQGKKRHPVKQRTAGGIDVAERPADHATQPARSRADSGRHFPCLRAAVAIPQERHGGARRQKRVYQGFRCKGLALAPRDAGRLGKMAYTRRRP